MSSVRFEGKVYPLFEGEDVLRGLLRGGASVAYSCRKGTCHTCMLCAVEGDPGAASREGLREDLRAQGCFLPCKSLPNGPLTVARPDPRSLAVRMHVQQREMFAPDVVRLVLEPETQFAWQPGQFLHVTDPRGAVRSYSIASVGAEDYFVELHVRRIAGGQVSSWLADQVAVGDVLLAQGPHGECVWQPADELDRDAPLLLVATGTGLAPLWAIARGALAQGHRGPITLVHGARTSAGLYQHEALRAWAARNDTVRYVGCVSGEHPPLPQGARAGRALDVAFELHADWTGFRVFFAGLPAMVDDGRRRAYAAGAAREHIRADPFEFSAPLVPEDDRKLATVQPDPELWAALGEGETLRAILEDFYTRVYADEKLAPFFHRVTKDHAVGKQYAFLADLFTGRRDYFGLKPFNAHHWMVISDALFDYRERLIESVMREHGLSDAMIRRWCAVHELFRRELVKSAPRGLIVDGVEQEPEKVTDERVEVATVCDGCASEMPEGSTGRLHWRSGQLYCARCAAKSAGSGSIAPEALAR